MPRLTTGYKLMRVRKDGTLGPLFINARQKIEMGEWVQSKTHPTPGFAIRPGWHAVKKPVAPHLSKRGRVWVKVSLKGVRLFDRGRSHGGTWLLAKWMRVDKVIG
jgi:hypothetical protein